MWAPVCLDSVHVKAGHRRASCAAFPDSEPALHSTAHGRHTESGADPARPRQFRATQVRAVFSEGGQHSPPERTDVERVAESAEEEREPGTKHCAEK